MGGLIIGILQYLNYIKGRGFQALADASWKPALTCERSAWPLLVMAHVHHDPAQIRTQGGAYLFTVSSFEHSLKGNAS